MASTEVAPGAPVSLVSSSGFSKPDQPQDNFKEPPPEGPLTSQTLTTPSDPQLIKVLSSRTSARSHTASVCPINSPRAQVSSYGAYVVCEGDGRAHTRMEESRDAEYKSCLEAECMSRVMAAE